MFFLARPHPRPDDLSLAVFAVNDWAARFARNQPGLDQGTFGELVSKAEDLNAAGGAFRAAARAVWRHLLSRRYIYSALSDKEKTSFAWDQLVTIWQVIGRLVRGGAPARVVFVYAAFAPRLASERTRRLSPGRCPLDDPGLLVRLRDVLAPYFAPGIDPGRFPDPADPALVRLLYQPLYEALCGIGVQTREEESAEGDESDSSGEQAASGSAGENEADTDPDVADAAGLSAEPDLGDESWSDRTLSK